MPKRKNEDSDLEILAAKEARKTHQKLVEEGKASKKVKPLPPGYVCKACGVKEDHAIYNCPNKKKSSTLSTTSSAISAVKTTSATSKDGSSSDSSSSDSDTSSGSGSSSSGTDIDSDDSDNEEQSAKKKKDSSKSRRDTNESSTDGTQQVYISGLPFDMTVAKFLKLVSDHGIEGLKQPFGVHLVPFEDNPSKCKGVAFVTFLSVQYAQQCCEKMSGLILNDKKPHMKLRAEINTKKQEKEWQPPSQTKVDLSFSGRIHDNTGKRKKKGASGTPRCYRCGGNCPDPKMCENPRICYRCKSTEHLSSQCPLKKNPTAVQVKIKPERTQDRAKMGISLATGATSNKKIKFDE